MSASLRRRGPSVAATLLAAGLMAGCGGGSVDVAGVGSGGSGGAPATAVNVNVTTTVSTGDTPPPAATGTQPATAVKSLSIGPLAYDTDLVVEGVRYVTAATRFTDSNGGSYASLQLGRGMVVEVVGTVDPARREGVAQRVRVMPPTRGPVSVIDKARRALYVMGREVTWDDQTAWSGESPDKLRSGALIEVWGIPDELAASLRATRIVMSLPRATDLVVDALGRTVYKGAVKVQGAVTHLDEAEKMAVVGTTPVSYEGTGITASQLAVGTIVAVEGARMARVGALQAKSVKSVAVDEIPDTDLAWIRGQAVSISKRTKTLRVSGYRVDVSEADWIGGSLDELRTGRGIAVSARVRNGTAFASTVQVLPVRESAPVDPPPVMPPGNLVAVVPLEDAVAGDLSTSVYCYDDRLGNSIQKGWRFWLWVCPGWRAVSFQEAGTLANSSFVYSNLVTGAKVSLPPIRMSPGSRPH
jgi:hypothetical protein